MKSTRIILAALLITLTAAGCDTKLTGPENISQPPVIGSGTGT